MPVFWRRQKRRWRSWALILRKSSTRQTIWGSEMAGSDDWPPVFWIRWPRSTFRRSDTGFTTSSAVPVGSFLMLIRWSIGITGRGTTLRGKLFDPIIRNAFAFMGMWKCGLTVRAAGDLFG